MKARRLGKKVDEIEQEYLTVQQLSASVEGKGQKYSWIGPLTMLPLVGDKTLENIKKSCIQHFHVNDESVMCDLLTGERGPSYTAVSQVKHWTLLHIRVIEAEANGSTVARAEKKRAGSHRNSEPSGMLEEEQIGNRPCSSFSLVKGRGGKSDVESSIFAQSVLLSQLIKIGTLIPPRNNIATVQVESFDVGHRCWQDSFKPGSH